MDKLYLEAEGLWRQAHLAAATAALSDARQQAVSSSKCADLHRMHAAEIACEDGMVLHICVQQQSHMLRHDNTINFPLF